jgi:citrate lyase subunit beta/citryl-CoA lyase
VGGNRSDVVERMRAMPPRSWLFVPATRTRELLPKAFSSGAEAVIVDLEDAVAPAEKERARAALIDGAPGGRRPALLVVRTNAASADTFEADIDAALEAHADGVIVPKAVDAHEIERTAALLEEREGGETRNRTAIVPLVETPRGVLAAERIAAASDRVVAVAFGGDDFAAEIGASRSRWGLELLHARGHVVLAAGAVGCGAVDTPCVVLDDPARVSREARLSRRLGFAGKLVIHPAHVAAVNEAFAPRPDEVDVAREIVRAFDTATAAGVGVVRVRGRMVDRPIAVAARRLLERAERDTGRGVAAPAPSERPT